MNIAITIFEFVVLIFSAVLHEVSHGMEAERLGDDTARRAGRLTLNPLKHLDPFGSLLLPISLYILSGGSFFFAAAKPVPYDPRNLAKPRSGSAKIALAGPIMNLLVALLFGILSIALPVAAGMKAQLFAAVSGGLAAPIGSGLAQVYFLFLIIVYINILLAIFNLIPIPPLDGSRVLFALLPQNERTYRAMIVLERWGLIIVLLFVLFGFQLIFPVINSIFTLFTWHF